MRRVGILMATMASCSGTTSTGGSPSPGGTTGGGGDLSMAAQDGGANEAAGPPHDYGSDGPSSVSKASLTVKSPNGSFTVVAFIPSGSGACPVVMLSSGLLQPAAAYGPYGQRLASWGVIVLTRDDPGVFSQTSTLVGDVGYVVSTWLAAQNADAGSPLHGRIDLGRVGLAGHSRGGQVSLLAAENELLGEVKAVFGLDPVDTTMGGGQAARTKLGSIAVPTGFIGETTNSSGDNACAPASDNYAVLFAAAPSPSVAITAVGADHTQFEDPAWCSFCGLCTAGSADGATVLAYSVRYLTAFFARELLGDGAVGPELQSLADQAAGLVTVQNK